MSTLSILPRLTLLGLILIPPKPADLPLRAAPQASVLDLSLDVQALRILYLLHVTPEQIQEMLKIAKENAQPDREREQPRVSNGYRRALADLREALIASKDDDKIEELEDRLVELSDSEEPEVDDEVRVTAAARRQVPEILRLLRPAQLANYLGSISEEVGDPQERLVAALEQVRSAKNDDWKSTCDELADDLGWLLGGLESRKSKAIRDEITALLTKTHNLSDEEFAKKRSELEKEARQVGADVAATDVLRHAIERALARLLSNPRLSVALEARLK